MAWNEQMRWMCVQFVCNGWLELHLRSYTFYANQPTNGLHLWGVNISTSVEGKN